MKIFINTPVVDAKEDEAQFISKEVEKNKTLLDVMAEKKPTEKVHICYHDEDKPRPCVLLD